MYSFKIASEEDVSEINRIKDLTLDSYLEPRIFVMKNNKKIISFVLVDLIEKGYYISYVYDNNLTSEELDFFYRSLVFALNNEPIFSPSNHKIYSEKISESLYKLVLPERICSDE